MLLLRWENGESLFGSPPQSCKLCRVGKANLRQSNCWFVLKVCFKCSCGSQLLSFSSPLRPAASTHPHRVYERDPPDRHLPADIILQKIGNIASRTASASARPLNSQLDIRLPGMATVSPSVEASRISVSSSILGLD